MKKTNCDFCGDVYREIYALNGYRVIQCQGCLTSTTLTAPSVDELQNYYQGFRFEVHLENLEKILKPEVCDWYSSMNIPEGAKMLDIGGGAGFFGKAFEEFGKGSSSYIDLDESSCRFAREELKLSNVICGDVEELQKEYKGNFDFIYCRHVIEHLIDPCRMIDASLNLLKPGGVYVLQFPNGLSLEYLAYPRRLRKFIENLKRSNHFSFFKVLRILASKRNAFGLDPIRHLWAISPRAIACYLSNRKELAVKTCAKSVSDSVFSPYYSSAHAVDVVRAAIARQTLARVRGGAHAVVTIRKANS